MSNSDFFRHLQALYDAGAKMDEAFGQILRLLTTLQRELERMRDADPIRYRMVEQQVGYSVIDNIPALKAQCRAYIETNARARAQLEDGERRAIADNAYGPPPAPANAGDPDRMALTTLFHDLALQLRGSTDPSESSNPIGDDV